MRAIGLVPTLAALIVVATTAALGNWQLGRAHEKEARAARVRALSAAPPLEIGAGPLPVPSGSLVSRRIVARGSFDAAHTVLLENRPHGDGKDSRSGFLVLTPLRIATPAPVLAGGRPATVLVLRGWLPRDPQDRTRIAPFATPAGDVTVEGVALGEVPKVYQLGDGDAPGQRIRLNLTLQQYAAELNAPLQPFVLQQHNDTGDGLARDWPPADLGVERHYGYAFQWYGLAALTLGLWVALTWRRARRRAIPAGHSGGYND